MSHHNALSIEGERAVDHKRSLAGFLARAISPRTLRRRGAATDRDAADGEPAGERPGGPSDVCNGSVQDATEAPDDLIDDAAEAAPSESQPEATTPERFRSGLRSAVIFGLFACVALGGLVGWLGFRANQSHTAEQRRELFLEAGRHGAVNLTTIDYNEVDADIKRVLDSSTGTFYDDFKQRSAAFAEVVKKAKSKTVGTITAAGLESVTNESAQMLVSVSVTTSNTAVPQQQPRRWRMRIDVQKVGDGAKVSNVVFVP